MSNESSFDFEKLARELLRSAEKHLIEWLPNGVTEGNEFSVGSKDGEAGKSLKININTGKWSDFASGDKGGDLLSLYAYIKGMNNGQAYLALGGEKPDKPKPKEIKRTVYNYPDGLVVTRVDYDDGSKNAYPFQTKNKIKGWPQVRPLFQPNDINSRGYLIVEGEKSALAAVEYFGKNYNVRTNPQGSNGVEKADWSVIPKDSQVLIWPDWDEPGAKWTAKIVTQLKKLGINDISVLDPNKKNLFPDEEGWDVADCLENNMTKAQVVEWAKEVKTKAGELAPLPPKKPSRSLAEADPENIANIQDLGVDLAQKNGAILPSMSNIIKILSLHPFFKNRFAYDEFLDECVIRRENNGDWASVEDHDKIYVRHYFQDKFGMHKVTKADVGDAILLVCMNNKRNMAQDWLTGLKWDGIPRLDNLFLGDEYFDCIMSQKNYLRAVGANFFKGMAARIMNPGCKVDNMLIIESQVQGTNKSQFFRIIGGDDWYAVPRARITSKDFLEGLRGNILIQFEELSILASGDKETKKDILTQPEDSYRPSYGRKNGKVKRSCVFAGTTNGNDYLDDPTGNRRYWPVSINYIWLDAVKRDRDQFFAEALVRYKAGETWWEVPLAEQEEVVGLRDISSESIDPWQEPIEKYFNKRPGREGYFQVDDILTHVIMKPVDARTSIDTRRIGKCLRNLGFKNGSLKPSGGGSLRRWHKTVHDKDPYEFDAPQAPGQKTLPF